MLQVVVSLKNLLQRSPHTHTHTQGRQVSFKLSQCVDQAHQIGRQICHARMIVLVTCVSTKHDKSEQDVNVQSSVTAELHIAIAAEPADAATGLIACSEFSLQILEESSQARGKC